MRLVGQVGLEDQTEGAALVLHVGEVGVHRRLDAQLVVRGRGERRADGLEQRLAVLVEQGEVELQLAGEVLVENGLADSRALRDVVHRRGVVALGDEDLLRGAQQLIASGTAGQPGAPRARRLCLLDGCHAASQNRVRTQSHRARCAVGPSYF